jgi:2,3-bisphosphoglycerate-independent phosphoglycerate mutase
MPKKSLIFTLQPLTAFMFLFLFLDGVGLGADDVSVNPFAAAKTPFLESLLKGKLTKELRAFSADTILFRHLDATLGFVGLPQSATGQTTLLTGKNGAAIMEGHYGPYPGPTLKKELDKGTLFSDVLATGKKAVLANLYPPGYFQAIETKQQKYNVPVYAALQAGLDLLRIDDYRAGRAVSADLTGAYLHKHDATLIPFSAFEMGQRLATLAQQHDFTFFDVWLTDHAGHRWPFEKCVELIETLDSFLQGVVENLGDVTLLVTSDHGNLEDKSVKTHTLADVPLLVVGKGAVHFEGATSLLEVAPNIRAVLGQR